MYGCNEDYFIKGWVSMNGSICLCARKIYIYKKNKYDMYGLVAHCLYETKLYCLFRGWGRGMWNYFKVVVKNWWFGH